mgnify:CR=1 FL=1
MRFQSHHRDLAASELEIGLGRALDLHELMQRTQHIQRRTPILHQHATRELHGTNRELDKTTAKVAQHARHTPSPLTTDTQLRRTG